MLAEKEKKMHKYKQYILYYLHVPGVRKQWQFENFNYWLIVLKRVRRTETYTLQ